MDVPNLILYSIQQLGVMFAVGAQTIILVAYLLAIRNGTVDEQEERFAKAVKRVLFVGLFFIIVSGLAITALELFAAHQPVVLSPAYLFKWCLIGFGVMLALATWGNSLPKGLLEGVVGATWSALFAVHILAPVATWPQLLMLYVVWLILFVLGWVGLVFGLRGKRAAVEAAVVEEKNTKVLKTEIKTEVKKLPAPIQPKRLIQPVTVSVAPVHKLLPVIVSEPKIFLPPAPVVAKPLVAKIISKFMPKRVVPVIPFRPLIPENLPVFTTESPLIPQPLQEPQAVAEQKIVGVNNPSGLPHV